MGRTSKKHKNPKGLALTHGKSSLALPTKTIGKRKKKKSKKSKKSKKKNKNVLFSANSRDMPPLGDEARFGRMRSTINVFDAQTGQRKLTLTGSSAMPGINMPLNPVQFCRQLAVNNGYEQCMQKTTKTSKLHVEEEDSSSSS